MGRRKKPTPNYDVMFESAVTGLMIAFDKFKKAVDEEHSYMFVSSDGYICILEGYEDRSKRREDAEKEVVRLMREVRRLRNLRGEEE